MNEYNAFHSQLALPFLETHEEFLRDIFEVLVGKYELKRGSDQEFIDLGSGDGRVVIFASCHYGIKSMGIEINSSLVKESREQVKLLKKDSSMNKSWVKKINIKQGDFFIINLTEINAEFIYTYSLPTMHKYLNHVFQTAQKRAIIISHKYPLEALTSILKLDHVVKHGEGKDNIKTFFYRLEKKNN